MIFILSRIYINKLHQELIYRPHALCYDSLQSASESKSRIMYFVSWSGGKLATKDPKYPAFDQQSRSLRRVVVGKRGGEKQLISGD